MRKKNHLKVGFIGTGAISSIIAKEIESGKLGNIEIVAVFDTNLSFANILVNQLNSNPYIYSSIENLVNNEKIDLIIECASQTAVEKNAELVLKANKDILVMSSGALLNKNLYTRLEEISDKNNTRIYIPSGAVGAIDTIKSLKGMINQVTITTIKNPISLIGSLGFKKWEDKGITEKKLIFKGNANEAIKLFPANVNIAATISLSGIGPENTKVLVYADPDSKINAHEVSIKSKAGNYKFLFENQPSKENPKTSYLAILSAIQTIRRINGNFIEIGS